MRTRNSGTCQNESLLVLSLQMMALSSAALRFQQSIRTVERNEASTPAESWPQTNEPADIHRALSPTIDSSAITTIKTMSSKSHNGEDRPFEQDDRDQPQRDDRTDMFPFRHYYLRNEGPKKVVYRQFGADAPSLLRVEEEPRMPVPECEDHVVLRIEASTVTLEDCSIRKGFDFDLWNPVSVPVTPGMDVVGHIVDVGSAVNPSLFQRNDRVAALVRTGGNARYISVPHQSLVRLPANASLDAAEAVAMVSIYTTAYQTLKRIKQKEQQSSKQPEATKNMNVFSLAGSTILVIGGMNAVGQALLQMCQKAKADKIYATGPIHRHSYLQHVLGAIPLPENGWLENGVYDIEGKMDYVFDGVNDDMWLDTSYRALKPRTGELVCYGYSAMLREQHMGVLGAPMTAHINKLWSHTLPRAQMLEIWESFQQDPETYKKNLKSLFQLLKWNKLKPRIAKRVGLDEVAISQAKLERGELRGTVVCLPWRS